MKFLIMSVIDDNRPNKVAVGIEQINKQGEIVRVFSLYFDKKEIRNKVNELIDSYALGCEVQTFTMAIYKSLQHRKDITLQYRKVQRYKNSLWQLTLDAVSRREDVIALV